MLNDRILIQALKVLKGVSSFENWEEELDEMITPKFIKQLMKDWHRIGRKNQAIIGELSRLPDDKISEQI